jgi:hypothetical protein
VKIKAGKVWQTYLQQYPQIGLAPGLLSRVPDLLAFSTIK